jgi:signal transduction histidine kinase
MNENIIILIAEALSVYFLVLFAHSLRHKFGLYHFYALIGGLTAIMSWVTDAGIKVQAFRITFLVGSTVFYTSLLLSVFVIYVFDGIKATRIAISTIIVVSILVPIISIVINIQTGLSDIPPQVKIPMPDIRINTASIITTAIDLVFLAIAWEYFGKLKFKVSLWLRSYLTLLGVMWLDVVLFNTGAFGGSPAYLQILEGTLTSRFIISLFAFPFLMGYVYWQNSKRNIESEAKPILSILKQVAEIKQELHLAKEEIAKRREIESVIRESLDKHRLLNERLDKENTMKEMILDVITHDLKNPAGAIKGFAGLLRDEYPKDDMILMVDKSVENLLDVLENATSLAMISGSEEIWKEELNLSELINQVFTEYKNILRETNIQLINNVNGNIFANANPIISEIFKNYISNAIKHASTGNKIIIDSVLTDGNALIKVKDFGTTIPEAERERIFLRNVQLNNIKKTGRGLGLSIAKSIAKAHDAEVGVFPNEPNGNVFYLKIKTIDK